MKSTIERLITSKSNTQLTSDDKKNIRDVILDTITDDSVDTYFQILAEYLRVKREKKLTTSNVAELCDLPDMTIKRFENLQTIPKALTLIKILDAVGLEITVSAKEE